MTNAHIACEQFKFARPVKNYSFEMKDGNIIADEIVNIKRKYNKDGSADATVKMESGNNIKVIFEMM